MNVINKCIDDIKFKIPKPILERVFIKRQSRWRQSHNNIDELIMTCVIRPRVLVDLQLVGGDEVIIPIEGLTVERMEDNSSVIFVPKEKTQGRSIVSVSNITFFHPNILAGPAIGSTVGSNAILRAGQAAMDAMGTVPAVSTARVQLIGENIVHLKDQMTIPVSAYINCTLAYDENLTQIHIRSYKQFSKLFEYAVKAYIYNEYIVEMDMGEIYAGQNLGVFKEIITGYADAEELYETHLREVIEKVCFMNDHEAFSALIRLQTGSYR